MNDTADSLLKKLDKAAKAGETVDILKYVTFTFEPRIAY